MILVSTAIATVAGAAPAEIDARVLWVRGDRVYVATPDSLALEEGMRLSFIGKRSTVATAEVLRVHDHELAVARLTSGTLDGIKRLDRLRVLAERRHVDVLSSLRIGYPSERRSNLWFGCGTVEAGARFPPSVYRSEPRVDAAQRLVRTTSASRAVPWPDTILVRFFDDVADQEIALERGELDAAVFWPGELSRRMRDDARWGMAHGVHPRGLVVASLWQTATGEDSTATQSLQGLDITSLNQQMFGGDLEAWPHTAGLSLVQPATPMPSLHFEVDPACPGKRAIERFLNRGRPSTQPSTEVRLAYLPGLIESPETRTSRPLFRLRSAVVWRPAVRTQLVRIGADAIVDLIQCSAPSAGRGQP